MKTNYILVDFENVQPKAINAPLDLPIKVLVFVGEKQTKLPMDLAISMQSLGGNAEYVRITGNGKNALDFHIAFTVGELSEKDPNSYFHIVSKDTGFDPLIKHLRKKKILAQRVSMISDIQILNGISNGSIKEKTNSIAQSLKLRGSSRPRKRKTLKNTIASMFMKTLSDEEIEALIENLEKDKLISFEKDIVSYNLKEVNQTVLTTPDAARPTS